MSAFADRAGRGAIASATDQRPGIPGAHDRNATNAIAPGYRDDRFCSPARVQRAIAKATKRSPGSSPIGTAAHDRIRPPASAGAGWGGSGGCGAGEPALGAGVTIREGSNVSSEAHPGLRRRTSGISGVVSSLADPGGVEPGLGG
jgi:hypothetical protein